MAEFRFKLGEVIATKEGIAQALLRCQYGEGGLPVLTTVVGRKTHECHGGTQVEYLCALMGEVRSFNDDELAPLSEWDANAARQISHAVALEWFKTKLKAEMDVTDSE